MKKFIVLIGVAASLVVGQAATYVATVTATNAVFLTNAVVLESVAALQATNGIIRLYDHADKGLTNVIGASVVVRMTNASVIYTNVGPTGMTNLWTNTEAYYYPYTNSAVTSSVSPFSVMLGVANELSSQTLNQPLTKGLVVSNAGSGDILIQYRTP